jgi:hypothetical protein
MIVVKIQGGLGNQMFQYAIGQILAEKSSSQLLLDTSFFDDQTKKPGFTPRQFELDVFNLHYTRASKEIINSFYSADPPKRWQKLLGISYKKSFREIASKFERQVLSLNPPLYLDGYFQSEKYFANKEFLVRQTFSFPRLENAEYENIIDEMLSKHSVAVHFRRGDYVSDALTESFHGTCSLQYYKQAFNYIKGKTDNPHFYIFSDDIAWVEQQISDWDFNTTFIKGNSGSSSWIDMMLMSKCKHHIIANSSFSWWGAWLSGNDASIKIAPQNWFNPEKAKFDINDIVPSSWIKMQ